MFSISLTSYGANCIYVYFMVAKTTSLLQKAQAQLKLPIVPSLQRLLIYRWAQQALVTPSDHPLLPLIWQKFFLLYLHRPGPQYGYEACSHEPTAESVCSYIVEYVSQSFFGDI